MGPTEVYRAHQVADANSYVIPETLRIGQTYYWRIDEVNDAHPDKLWKGAVWSFTTGDYLTVDDMESCGDAATAGPPPPPGSRIWYTWKDGEGWLNPTPVAGNGTGSVVDPNDGTVHGRTQSLKFYYDNDGTNVLGTSGKKYYSEVTANTAHLAIGKPNWTEDGVKALTLWFYGDPGNDADTTEQMYVKLNGEKINYDGDMNDIRQASWHEWNIDLAQFGMDLSNVTEMAIGFGNETNTTTPGGSGTVHFDDIRLYWPRCRPGLLAVAGDFDGDCLVGYADLAMLASDWLAAEETIAFAPNEMKKPATPVLWYKFDEAAGIAVTDHAGFYDGTVMNLGDDTWDTSGGRDGNGCINLVAGSQTFVEVPPVALNFASTTQKITFAAWVNGDRDNPQDTYWQNSLSLFKREAFALTNRSSASLAVFNLKSRLVSPSPA